jgi:hypothetical protein
MAVRRPAMLAYLDDEFYDEVDSELGEEHPLIEFI